MIRALPCLLLAGSLVACDRPADRPTINNASGEQPRVEISDAWARPVTRREETPANSAVYFTLTNRGDQALSLLEVLTDAAARAEVHETQIDDGVMRMRPAAGVTIESDAEVRFEPGGLHIMLLELQRDLVAGDSLYLTLRFDDDSQLVAPVVVRPAAL